MAAKKPHSACSKDFFSLLDRTFSEELQNNKPGSRPLDVRRKGAKWSISSIIILHICSDVRHAPSLVAGFSVSSGYMLFLRESSYVLNDLQSLVLGLPRAQIINSSPDLHKRFRWLELIYRDGRVSKSDKTPPGFTRMEPRTHGRGRGRGRIEDDR